MKNQINEEFKRMQLLAGLITESQLNEDILELKQMSKQLYTLLKSKGIPVELVNKITTPLRPENPNSGTFTKEKSSITSEKNELTAQIVVEEGKNEMVSVVITPANAARAIVGGGNDWTNKESAKFGNDWAEWQKNPEIMKYVDNLGNELLKEIKSKYPNMIYKFDQGNFYYVLHFGYGQTKKGGQKDLKQRPNAPKPAAPTPVAESMDIESIVNKALGKYRKNK